MASQTVHNTHLTVCDIWVQFTIFRKIEFKDCFLTIFCYTTIYLTHQKEKIMSYNAFYFTMSPEDMKAISDMPEEQAIKTLKELQDKGVSTDSDFWGKELHCIIESCKVASALNLYEIEQEPQFRQILQKTFGEGNYYSSEIVERIANDLIRVKISSGSPNWKSEIFRVLKKYDKDLGLRDELMGVMLRITKVFVYAKKHGHIVVNYWA